MPGAGVGPHGGPGGPGKTDPPAGGHESGPGRALLVGGYKGLSGNSYVVGELDAAGTGGDGEPAPGAALAAIPIRTPASCDHGETICRECAGTWVTGGWALRFARTAGGRRLRDDLGGDAPAEMAARRAACLDPAAVRAIQRRLCRRLQAAPSRYRSLRRHQLCRRARHGLGVAFCGSTPLPGTVLPNAIRQRHPGNPVPAAPGRGPSRAHTAPVRARPFPVPAIPPSPGTRPGCGRPRHHLAGHLNIRRMPQQPLRVGLDYSISPRWPAGGGGHRWVIFSVACLCVRCLLRCLMVLPRRQVSKDAELLVLRHENAVLRRQTGRVCYQPGGRLWFAALSRLSPRHRWGEVFTVTPATLLAWHRRLVARKWDYGSRRRPGRPSTAAAIRKLVIRTATDIPPGAQAGARGARPGGSS
jgi:hypothetical protein